MNEQQLNSRDLLVKRFQQIGEAVRKAEKASTSPAPSEGEDCYKAFLDIATKELLQAGKEGSAGLSRLKSLYGLLGNVFGVEKAVAESGIGGSFEDPSPGHLTIPTVVSEFQHVAKPPVAMQVNSRTSDSFNLNGPLPKSNINAASGGVSGGPNMLPPQTQTGATAFSVNKAAAEAAKNPFTFWDRKDLAELAQPKEKTKGKPIFIPKAGPIPSVHPADLMRAASQQMTDDDSQIIHLR